MIQTLTINVNIPDGYEATGDFRYPNPGEQWLTSSGTAHACHDNDKCGLKTKRVILRKKWALPDWFRQGWRLVSCVSGHFVGRMDGGTLCWAATLWGLHDDVFVPPPAGAQFPICKK